MSICSCNQKCSCGHGCGVVPGGCVPKNCSKSKADLRIKTEVIPASAGTDEKGQPFAPKFGRYFNTVVQYAANDATYIYDSQGIWTKMNSTMTIDDAIAALKQQIGKIEKVEVQFDTIVEGDASTVSLVKSQGDMLTDSPVETSMPLPVASETNAGVMNVATFNAVQKNSEDIDSILGGAVAIDNLPATPTQEELTSAWKTATGKAELVNRASILDEANQKTWYYYANISSWKAISGSSEVTVNQFTNESAGIIKGSTVSGQISAEPDGTGSVNGWDGLKHDIENLSELVHSQSIPKLYDTQSDATDGAYTAAYLNPTVNKVEGLANIKTIGRNLNLTEDGTLNATGGGEGATTVNELGYSETEAISQAAATKMLYPTTGDTTHTNLVTADNSLGTPAANAQAVVVGANNTIQSTSGEYNVPVIYGYGNATTDASEGYTFLFGRGNTISKSYGDMIFGTMNKINSNTSNASNQIIFGGWNTLNIPAIESFGNSLIIGTNNTLNSTGQLAIGRYNSTTSTETDTLIGRNIVNTADDSIAESTDPNTGARGSIFVGRVAKSKGFGNVLIGNNVITGSDQNTLRSTKMSVALGNHSCTNRDYETSIGGTYYRNNTWMPFTRYLANVTAGELDTDAVNVKQMKDYVAANAGGVNSATYTADNVNLGSVALEPAKGTQGGMVGQAGIMSSFQATQLAALAEAYKAEEKGTILYEGTASVNNIELSESGFTYDHLIVVGQYMGMGSSALDQQVSAVFYPTDSVKSFQMNATDLTVGDAPAKTDVQDIWMISEDGLELDLVSSIKSTIISMKEDGATESKVTFDVTPDTTSMFTITKVVGFGKKVVTGE